MRAWIGAGVALVSFAALLISGCPAQSDDSAATFLVGLDEQYAYVQHFEHWSGFETFASSVWQVDRTSGQAERVRDPRVRYGLQVAGRRALTERPTDGGSEVVAEPLDGGNARVLAERNVKLGGRYDAAVVANATQAIVRTDLGLLVVDLSNPDVSRSIPIDDQLSEVLAASDEWALVYAGPVDRAAARLVHLASGEIVVPTAPAEFQPIFSNAIFDKNRLWMTAFVSSGGAYEQVLVSYDLETRAWGQPRPISTFNPLIGAFLLGVSDDLAILQTVALGGGVLIEQYSLRDNARATLVSEKTATSISAIVSNGVLCWISPVDSQLRMLDLSTRSTTAVPLHIGD